MMMTVRFALRATLLAALVALPSAARAQSIDDGVMLTRHTLFAGDLYSYERWDEYWEGTLQRGNGNIGTVSTRTNVLLATYGVTDRLNVLGTVPHVSTRASQGVLQGMQGFQDLALAAKYRLAEWRGTPVGTLRAIVVAAGHLPLSDYTPDFMPLSIGSASRRLSGRMTVNAQAESGWYVNGSTAYTVRSDVTLDRPYFFTDGELFFSDTVDMPNVHDYVVSGGFQRGRLRAEGSFFQQHTLGGGDIRRQDMPFVSNRMNASRVGGMVMAPIVRSLAAQVAYGYTVAGRNVGQTTSFSAGLLYTFPYRGRTVQ